MKRKYTDVEEWLLVTLSIALMFLIIWGFAVKCAEDRVDEPATTHGEVYNVTPPNIEVESIVVEPITVPEVLTGETSFIKVGLSSVESALDDMDLGICAWADIILTEEEMNLLRTTVYCEVGDQDIDTQVMVALTILNRLNAGYAEDIRGVIYEPNAYAVTKWSNFEQRGWTEQVAEAVDIALVKNEHPPTMFYFKMGSYHNFQGVVNYMKSGTEYFSIRK